MRTALWAVPVAVAVLAGGLTIASGGIPARKAPAWLTTRKIAHRGYWADGFEAPENSVPAFERAAKANYAIELDVQLTSDGEIVVVHDEDLQALTGAPGKVSEMTLAQIKQRRLLDGEFTVPTLAEVLRAVHGRVPIFVEIKNDGDIGKLEDGVASQLAEYDGDSAVMSFNPYSLARVAESAPDIPRGQLASAFRDEDLAGIKKLLLRNMLMNWKSRPDFIAYDIGELPTFPCDVQKRLGRPLIGWTIDDEQELEYAKRYCDGFICNPDALTR